jgi:hypothetical protein
MVETARTGPGVVTNSRSKQTAKRPNGLPNAKTENQAQDQDQSPEPLHQFIQPQCMRVMLLGTFRE